MDSFWCLSDSFIQYYKTRTVWRFLLFTDVSSKDERPGNFGRPPSFLLSLFLTVGHFPTKIWILCVITTPLSSLLSLWKDHGSLIAHNLSFFLVVDNVWGTQEVCNWWWFWFRLLILLYFYSKENWMLLKCHRMGFPFYFYHLLTM